MNTLSARALALLVDGWRGAAAGPAYLALAERVRLLILDGRITLGARVPAERDLAAQLGVLCGFVPYIEKRSFNLVMVKDIQHWSCDCGFRPVIYGQGDLVAPFC